MEEVRPCDIRLLGRVSIMHASPGCGYTSEALKTSSFRVRAGAIAMVMEQRFITDHSREVVQNVVELGDRGVETCVLLSDGRLGWTWNSALS